MLLDVGNKKILFLMAVDLEYGDCLRKLFKPLFIGVGPVEAAINTTKALAALKAEDNLPDYIISLGSAGSAKLDRCSVYQVQSVSWRDMDASPLGVEKGVTPFLDRPAVISMPCLLNDCPKASLSTGSNVVTGRGYDAIDADMVDMETYAVLRSCQAYDVPLLGFRGISDGRDDLQHAHSWREYLHIIDEKLANTVKN